ncbi:MAG: type II secretion system protein [Phycisphaeraceae bacterium]|nr:MAG: type II secretion system protein [Phycisphaeraceae bacterium]
MTPFAYANPNHRRAGMTLLELIIALTLFAFIGSMAATLWSQARSWTDENAAAERSVRTHRVADFMQRQWADRRSDIAGFSAESDAVLVTANRIEFITASPALFPEWPLVRAAYMIERDELYTGPPEQAPCRLVYEETRVTRLDTFEDTAYDRRGERKKEVITLLDDCRNLRWERFSIEEIVGDLESVFGIPEGVDPWLTPENGVAAERRPGEDGEPAPRTSRAAREAAEESERRERPPLRGVRLKGVHKDREFTWVLVGAGSR